MRKYFLLFFIVSSVFHTRGQDKAAYQLFTGEGKKIKYSKMVEDLAEADIVLFGELHDNPICHWLQHEIMKDFHAEHGNDLILGAEMFETDDQLILDEFLSGIVVKERFLEEAKTWKNFETDYAPLVNFAKRNNIPFIATNIPRRYANLVYREGFTALDTLTERAREYIAPLPVPFDPLLPNYRAMIGMDGMPGRIHGNDNLLKAQAIKDATMAHFILENREPGTIFLHFNGDYHSKDHEGIVWYVNRYEKGLNIKVISSVLQENPGKLEDINKGRGDYILVIPKSMTRTY
ncbi:MAG: ChaN family lipoprotein [Bacteroidota bacterium]